MDQDLVTQAVQSLVAELTRRKRGLAEDAAGLLAGGRPEEAEERYRRLLELDESEPEAWRGLGLVARRRGDPQGAARFLLRSLEHDPWNARTHFELGAALRESGAPPSLPPNWEDELRSASRAQAALRLELHHPPEEPGAAGDPAEDLLRAGLLVGRQDLEGAIRLYENAVRERPRDDLPRRHLATALELKGDPLGAARARGIAARCAEDFPRAIASLREALGLGASDPGDYLLLAECHLALEEFDSAATACREGLALHPDTPRLSCLLSIALQRCGFTEEAIAVAAEAARRAPGDVPLKFRAALTVPTLFDDAGEIDRYWARYARELERLGREAAPESPEWTRSALEAVAHIRGTPLAYVDRDLTGFQRGYGELLHRATAAGFPHLAERPDPHGGRPGRRLRVGYLSRRLGRSAGSYWALGWVRDHDRREFEIYCYHLDPRMDAVTLEFRSHSDTFRQLTRDVGVAGAWVRHDELDILVHLDCFGDPFTMELAALRLAPVQCCGWGIPFTSGLPTIDYYLSGELFEPEDGDAHYTETLVRLPGIGATYPRPLVPEAAGRRAEFQLPEGVVVYLSLQAPFKHLPHHDRIYPAIAERVPGAVFVFRGVAYGDITRRFRRRLEAVFRERGLASEAYCRFLPALPEWDRYMRRNLHGDVFLDTLGWSGCVTTLDAVACGLPVVTCPGRYRRGRHSYGILRMISVPETIAGDEAGYVEIAARLGLDAEFRRDVRRRVTDQHPAAFGDRACLAAVEAFYRSVA